VFDAAGGTVIPGPQYRPSRPPAAAAAALHSVQVGPAQVHGRDGLARALAGAPVGTDGWFVPSATTSRSWSAGSGRAGRHRSAVPVRISAPQRRGVDAELGRAGRGRAADHPDGRLRSYDAWSDAVARRETTLPN
jgi:hypothetical protein